MWAYPSIGNIAWNELTREQIGEVLVKLRAAGRSLDCLEQIRCPLKALEATDYTGMSPDQVARAVAHTTKAADVLFRLVEFARGKPDRRLDLGTDWLRGLSDEQLRTVQRWIEERETKDGG